MLDQNVLKIKHQEQVKESPSYNQQIAEANRPFPLEVETSQRSLEETISPTLENQSPHQKAYSIQKCKNSILNCFLSLKNQMQEGCPAGRKHIYTIISLLMSIVVLINYNQLRQRCPYTTQQQCLKQFIVGKLKGWVKLILINSCIAIVQMYFLLKKKGNIRVVLFGVFQIFYLYIFTEQTISINNYIGAINLIHLIIISILVVSYYLFKLIAKLIKMNWKLTLTVFSLLILLSSLYTYYIITNSCHYWTQGITGEIINPDGVCRIRVPPYCWYNVINGYLDVSFIINNCYRSEQGRNNFRKYYQRSLTAGPFIGLPNTDRFTEDQRFSDVFQQSIFNTAKGFKTYEQAQDHEDRFDIIFDSKKQKYHIDVKRNSTLVKERKLKWKKGLNSQSVPLAKNLLIIYTDAIGRQSMHIKLPNTVKWFKERARSQSYTDKQAIKSADPTKDQAYEFYRYNSYQALTVPNQMRMFYGDGLDELRDAHKQGDPPFKTIFQTFKSRGYITGLSNSFCDTLSMGYDSRYYNLAESIHVDHQLSAYACDPNFMNPENIYSFYQGPYSMGMHCLYDRTLSQYTVDAAKSFFETYSDMPKAYMMQFIEGHEGTGDVVNSIDRPISNLLKQLQRKDMLEDTVVMLISDHGLHMQGIFFFLQVQNMFTEKKLPGLLISVPGKLNSVYRENIARNQQLFVTVLNFYHFLNHIVTGKDYDKNELSLLANISSQNCAYMGVSDQECACKL